MDELLTSGDIELTVKLAGCSLAETPGKDNWVDKAGGLPTYICEIARAIKKTGKTTSQAIAIAVSRCKKWAAGDSNVDADTRAKAAAAVTAWEALKAKAHTKDVVKASREDGSEYLILSNVSSYSMDRVRDAFQAKERAKRDLIEQANAALRSVADRSAVYSTMYPESIPCEYRYVREVWTDFVIVEDGKSPQGFVKVPYTVGEDSSITWGPDTPVLQEYVDVPTTALGRVRAAYAGPPAGGSS